MHSNLNNLVLEKALKQGAAIRKSDIVRATGLSKSTIDRWMSPEPIQHINSNIVTALCKYLNCDLTDLLYMDRGDWQNAGQA